MFFGTVNNTHFGWDSEPRAELNQHFSHTCYVFTISLVHFATSEEHKGKTGHNCCCHPGCQHHPHQLQFICRFLINNWKWMLALFSLSRRVAAKWCFWSCNFWCHALLKAIECNAMLCKRHLILRANKLHACFEKILKLVWVVTSAIWSDGKFSNLLVKKCCYSVFFKS